MFDILIKNGTVIDGTGEVGHKQDLAISKGKITQIAPNIDPKTASVVIDAQDKFVTPGFVDIQNHSDSYWTLFNNPGQDSLIMQGITTIVVGNCGSSLAPLSGRESIKTIQKWHDLSGSNINWTTFKEFGEVLANLKLGVNVASLVGHATLRRGLLGDEIRQITSEEQKMMEKLLETALDQGALGMSLGLIYAHEVNSAKTELIGLISKLPKSKKYLSVHLRSEASHILEAIDESLDLARETGVGIKISHLKIRGQKNWSQFDYIISKLENAYHQGVNVSFDVYPYDTSWSVLYTYLPKWVYEQGRAGILKHLSNPLDRRKIIDYLKDQSQDSEKIVIASAKGNPGFVGKTLGQIAGSQGVSKEEVILNILAASDTQVIVFDHNLSAEQMELFLASPLSVVATDSAGYGYDTEELIHPRCFGAMPKFLEIVREKKLMKWEQAIKKITSEPAKIAGIKMRGTISKNNFADIVVFDPKIIKDQSTYQHPVASPAGIEAVIINGALAVKSGQLIARSGSFIR